MKTVTEMAREAHRELVTLDYPGHMGQLDPWTLRLIERFAEIDRADERNRTWTQEHWTEYENSIAAAEREACAKLCEGIVALNEYAYADECATAIRARSNT